MVTQKVTKHFDHLRLEDQLILCCARLKINDETCSRAWNLLQYDLEWDYIMKNSFRHGVAPLLYYNLTKFDTGGIIPQKIIQKLRGVYCTTAGKNISIYHELNKLLKLFTDSKISVIVLKGVALAELIYKNIALRPMVDIDLLIRKEDIIRVEKKLFLLGYVLQESFQPRQWFIEYHDHLPLYVKHNYGNEIGIEIHWNIFTKDCPFKIDCEHMWGNAQKATIANVDVLLFSPEDLLQHLCIHLINTNAIVDLPRLLWYCDIAEVIKHYEKEMNWDYILHTSRRWNIAPAINECLSAVNKWFNVAIPKEILDNLKSKESLIFFPDIFDPKKFKGKEGRYLSAVARIEGTQEKIWFILKDIFRTNVFLNQRYSVKYPLFKNFYYLIRLGKAAFRGTKALKELICFFSKGRLHKRNTL